MELFTIIGVVILIIVLVTLAKVLIHSFRAVFYVLLIVLVLVFFFGVSYTDLIDGFISALLLVF